MKVVELKLNSYRGIKGLQLSFDPNINVLIGENGVGKSSILDCIAVLLSRLTTRIHTAKGVGRFFKDSDIRNRTSLTNNQITIELNGKNIVWSVIKSRSSKGSQTITNLDQVKLVAEEIRESLEMGREKNIPLAIYYPVHRAVLDIPLRIKQKHVFEQFQAYEQALDGNLSNFRIFFEWFRNREDLENELRNSDRSYIDSQLRAVRKAISVLLPKVSDVKVKRSPLRMVLLKDGQELSVQQLSDGEKCLLALVGDLARRLALANPVLVDSLEGHAIVMIDEIELHLHPLWQRNVIPALTKTFPNCQFIVSTHSPQVLSHVEAKSIFVLRNENGIIHKSQPISSFGLDANRLLEDLMGTDERPKEIKNMLEELFDLIERKELELARGKLTEIKLKIGSDPELLKAETLIRRKETIGK